jgi:antimicrobial peptide system SdpB family protein
MLKRDPARSVLSPCGPWSRAFGWGRSILAAATLLTLLFNDPLYIFRPLGIGADEIITNDVMRFSLFSLFEIHLARWIAVGVLAVVVSGWRPRLTGLLHWWVAASFAVSAVIVEGGDQVCAVLSLLLVPVTLFDSRKWHWQRVACASEESLATFVARSGLFMIRLQIAVIYLSAAIGKFKVTEWVNGTALYYWFTHPVFGVIDWRATVSAPILTSWLVVPLTWSVLAVELLLGMALFGTPKMRRVMFAVGVLFHLGIIVMHGLVSFGLAMIAALVLYLRTPVSCGHEGARENAEPLRTDSLAREEVVA